MRSNFSSRDKSAAVAFWARQEEDWLLGPEEDMLVPSLGFQEMRKARTKRKRETIDMNFRREQEKKLEMRRGVPFLSSASCGTQWGWGRECDRPTLTS
jgi:hypothetical protein